MYYINLPYTSMWMERLFLHLISYVGVGTTHTLLRDGSLISQSSSFVAIGEL